MIGTVITKELRALCRDSRLLMLALATFCMVAGVLATSTTAAKRAQSERDQVGTTARVQWERQGVKHPHRAAHFGIYAFKPSFALAADEPGISAQVGQSLWLEPHKRNLPRHSPATDAPPSTRLGEVMPAFVLIVLVPLLVIGIGHNAVSDERESGTLRMLHAAGLQNGTLLMGKWIALVLAIGIVLSPAVAASAWLMAATGWENGSLLRAVLYGGGLLVYYAVIAALTIAVSARLRTSRGALLVLVALWIAFSWIVPRLGAAAAEALLPVPTGEAFAAGVMTDIQRGLPGDGDAASRLAAFDAALLREHKVARLDDLPYGANAARRIFRDAYATRVYALHFNRLWERYADQQALLRLGAMLSPVLPVQGLSMTLAGTDLAHQRHFEEAAEAYRAYFTVQIDEWDRQATRGIVSYEEKYASGSQWQAIAPFSYQPPGLRFAVRAAAADALLLVGWLAGGAFLVAWAGRRLKP